MLNVVTDLFRELNLLDPGDEPVYDVAISSPAMYNIGAFTARGNFFHVKVKNIGHLPEEYRNCRNAWEAFPRYAPKPLGNYLRGGWEILVVRGIRHRALSSHGLKGSGREVRQEIVRYLRFAARTAPVLQPTEPHAAALGRLQARETDPACLSVLRQWLRSDALASLPCIRQHGDFVVNNLGTTGSGLVVFDWEDFGRVCLPGFDLCTLLASEVRFDPVQLRMMMDADGRFPAVYRELIEAGSAAAGVESGLFRRMMPLHLVVFLDMKRSYGPAIVDRVKTALAGLQLT